MPWWEYILIPILLLPFALASAFAIVVIFYVLEYDEETNRNIP